MAKAAEDVQSCIDSYWQAYEEGQCEYPAEIFPDGVDEYGESAQSTQVVTSYHLLNTTTSVSRCRERVIAIFLPSADQR